MLYDTAMCVSNFASKQLRGIRSNWKNGVLAVHVSGYDQLYVRTKSKVHDHCWQYHFLLVYNYDYPLGVPI